MTDEERKQLGRILEGQETLKDMVTEHGKQIEEHGNRLRHLERQIGENGGHGISATLLRVEKRFDEWQSQVEHRLRNAENEIGHAHRRIDSRISTEDIFGDPKSIEESKTRLENEYKRRINQLMAALIAAGGVGAALVGVIATLFLGG